MKILMISAEASPFARDGAMADSVSGLAVGLSKLGHDVRIVIPRYYCINRHSLRKLDEPMGVPFAGQEYWTAVYAGAMPTIDALKFYFIDYEEFYGRFGIYGQNGEPEYKDNYLRFSLLCHAAFQVCRKINWTPDIIHTHDWLSSLANVLLKHGSDDERFTKTPSVLTIHNIAYQGIFSKDVYPSLGLFLEKFSEIGFDFEGKMNFLKAGIECSDELTTVSPSHAAALKLPEHGCGLDALLREKSAHFTGILSGMNTNAWNPEKDVYIEQDFSAKNISLKVLNKKALQRKLELTINEKIPLIGFIGHLTDEKGINELFSLENGCIDAICNKLKVQVVVLGVGAPWCEQRIHGLSEQYRNFASHIGYDKELDHLITAAADFLLMPSRFEPAGLQQLHALSYGALPIVHKVGGLADTVSGYTPEAKDCTGFTFTDLTPQAIFDTVQLATNLWYDNPAKITEMKKRAMMQDFSWDYTAKKYEEVYKKALNTI